MAIHVLQRTQVVRASIEECWEFFSNPHNLAAITPRALNLVVLNELPTHVHPGLMIEYRVRPILGIPLTWLTEITHVEELRYFVDEQRVGPYRLWHHEHFFTSIGNGHVEIRDRVHYVLPFTPLSEIVHPFIVLPQLEKIFAFREQAVRQRFGDSGDSNPNGS
ncbi:SRPBCC family protein [Verrucomicrobiota bacterium sgz303538]